MSLHTFTLLMTIRNAQWIIRHLYSLKLVLHLCIDMIFESYTTINIDNPEKCSKINKVQNVQHLLLPSPPI